MQGKNAHLCCRSRVAIEQIGRRIVEAGQSTPLGLIATPTRTKISEKSRYPASQLQQDYLASGRHHQQAILSSPNLPRNHNYRPRWGYHCHAQSCPQKTLRGKDQSQVDHQETGRGVLLQDGKRDRPQQTTGKTHHLRNVAASTDNHQEILQGISGCPMEIHSHSGQRHRRARLSA